MRSMKAVGAAQRSHAPEPGARVLRRPIIDWSDVLYMGRDLAFIPARKEAHHETCQLDLAGHAGLRRFRSMVRKRRGKHAEAHRCAGNRHRFRHVGRELRRAARQRHARSRAAL
ncbi:hypothetical protein PSAC2689_120194 [Paraburkholderia sacchari]